MADLKPLATQVAKRYGVPVGIAHGLIQQESGWNPSARNPSGATGLMQIHLPSHPDISEAQALNPRFAINWGLKYLRSQYDRFGSWKLALAAYNAGPGNVESGKWQSFAETRNYVKSVLGYAGQPADKTAPAPVATTPVAATPGIESPLPTSPADLSGLALSNLAAIAGGKQKPSPIDMLSGLTMTVAAQPQLAAPSPAPAPPSSAGAPVSQGNDWAKWVGQIEKRQGPSEPHRPEILQFVGRIGQRAGQVLTPWGNESHSLTTVNGTPSAHAHGWAADIPATGSRLRQLGFHALVAAGMSPAQARAAAKKGGLFNIGGYQIIFATDIGGNHWDHVHVALRGRK